MKWAFPAITLALFSCHRSAEHSSTAGQTVASAITEERPDLRGRFCEITSITDGDTLTARIDGEKVKVRLEGIDAPEKAQQGGKASTDALRALVAVGPFYIIPTGTDRYGRTLARVEAHGQDVNVEQVRQGMAWHFLRYNHDEDLARAEQEARAAKRGLWAEAEPLPPWEWRKEKKRKEPVN